jgi:uncharacterized protein
MSTFPNPYQPAQGVPLDYEQRVDARALASFFNSVYAWMAAGLGLSALVAWWVSTRPDIQQRIGGGTFLLLFVIEIFLVLAVAGAINRINATTATILFLLFAALNGVTLYGIFFVYAKATITSAFVVSAGTFAAVSAYGFVTRRNLMNMYGYLMMGLIGVIIASVVSIFWHPTMLTVLINYIGVAVFVGLTAYDTQRLKMIAFQTADNGALAARLSISGALALYLDFLNLFLLILSIFNGNDRR